MDIETATRENVPILTVILNNQKMAGYDRKLPVAQHGFRFNRMSGDYCGVARALGAFAERVTERADIAPAIERAKAHIATGQTAVLEIMTCRGNRVPAPQPV